ncbi:Golgi SNAP receptor complex member 1-like, partial [Boleophthalmus pectinirostris]|uniref:Golgi SNAP receptor complex member 1-like n=1 Tax=Boleophthalmus pectinirostris TaxID=150288 RepID=UPI00242EEE20
AIEGHLLLLQLSVCISAFSGEISLSAFSSKSNHKAFIRPKLGERALTSFRAVSSFRLKVNLIFFICVLSFHCRSYKSSSGVNNRRTELFLKEHEHLRNSDRLIDNAISIAMATKENMTFQRGVLKSIQTRVTTLANRFPAINSLIQKINLRKRRDSLILGTVIGVCTILLLLYTFH